MARRNPSNKPSEATATDNNEVTEETNVSTTAEAPASTEEKTETPVDLSGFEAATARAIAEADTSTGTIPPSEVEKVVVEYRTLDGIKAKNKAKAFLNEGMKSAMNESDIVQARSYLQLTESMTAGSTSKTEKAPADPTEAFVQRVQRRSPAGAATTQHHRDARRRGIQCRDNSSLEPGVRSHHGFASTIGICTPRALAVRTASG